MLFCIQQNQKLFWRSKKYLGIDLFNSTISRMSEHYIQIFALIFHRWWWCTIFDKKVLQREIIKTYWYYQMCYANSFILHYRSIQSISLFAMATYYAFDYDILGAILFCKCDDVFPYSNMKYIERIYLFWHVRTSILLV